MSKFKFVVTLILRSIAIIDTPEEVDNLQNKWERLKNDPETPKNLIQPVEEILAKQMYHSLQSLKLEREMKKLLSTIAMLLPFILFAQSWGIHAGVSGSTFYGSSYSDVQPTNPKIGAVAGVYDRIELSKRFILQPEVNYVNKGTLINHESPGIGNQFRLNLNYAQINALAGIRFNKVALCAGWYGAYLINMRIRKFNYDSPITEFNKKDFRVIDHGFITALSVDLDGGIIELRYAQGLVVVGHPGRPLGGWGAENKEAHTNANMELVFKIPWNL